MGGGGSGNAFIDYAIRLVTFISMINQPEQLWGSSHLEEEEDLALMTKQVPF